MSNLWTEQADGSFLGAATPRAIEWAETQPQRQTALAQVGFVAWCREMKLDILWTVDDPHISIIEGQIVTTLLDTTFAFDEADSFSVFGPVERGKTYSIVRIIPTGDGAVIHILGLSGTLDQREFPCPRHNLLSCREWLRSFPQHQVSYEEVQHAHPRPEGNHARQAHPPAHKGQHRRQAQQRGNAPR